MNRADDVPSESAVLVAVLSNRSGFNGHPLEELEGLAETVGVEVVAELTQWRQTPDAATYLGRGKVEELTSLAAMRNADVILFDNDLTPAQMRNLEKATGVRVLDRTEVILDIFASRAQTHEARLAVELAQLEYAMPRLKRMWTHLSRLKKGAGLRGPGEKQLEVDRRLVERRISELRSELARVHRRREREVAARHDRMNVSLVGYTNAGKSTLLNRLTGADVFTQDALFATLDTRTRRWQLPGWGPVLLSDTVGFIRNLPHHLIASFKATLEEARQADLLLHVADGSSHSVVEQIAAAYAVLEEIGIRQKDTLLVLNKIDRLEDRGRLISLTNRFPNAVPISARSGEGLPQLAAVVSDALSRTFLDLDVETAAGNGRLLAYLSAHGEVLSKEYHDDRVVVHCRMPRGHLGRIQREDAVVRRREEHAPSNTR